MTEKHPAISKETLRQIEHLAYTGMKDKDIAMLIGISFESFKLLLRQYSEIGQALAKGRLTQAKEVMQASKAFIEQALEDRKPPPSRELDRLLAHVKHFEPEPTEKDFDDEAQTPESIKAAIKKLLDKNK